MLCAIKPFILRIGNFILAYINHGLHFYFPKLTWVLIYCFPDKAFLLVYEAIKTTTRWGGEGIWEGSFGCELFTWVDVCWENRLWERRWVLRGTGATNSLKTLLGTLSLGSALRFRINVPITHFPLNAHLENWRTRYWFLGQFDVTVLITAYAID